MVSEFVSGMVFLSVLNSMEYLTEGVSNCSDINLKYAVKNVRKISRIPRKHSIRNENKHVWLPARSLRGQTLAETVTVVEETTTVNNVVRTSPPD